MLTLLALFSLLPSLTLAQADAGAQRSTATPPMPPSPPSPPTLPAPSTPVGPARPAPSPEEDRRLREEARKTRDAARKAEEAGNEQERQRLREVARRLEEEARKVREAFREHQRVAKEQARKVELQMREQIKQAERLAREQMKDVERNAREIARHQRDIDRHMREIAKEQRKRMLYPRLGITVKSDSSPVSVGVEVREVKDGSPAQKAGIRAGDVLTAINGQPLVEPKDAGIESAAHAMGKLMALLYGSKPGEKVKVDFQRGGQAHHADVALEMEPGWAAIREKIRLKEEGLPAFWQDIELVSLDRDLGAYFGTDHGLLVVRGSKKAKLKLKGGDVILRIGEQAPQTPMEAVRLLRSYDGQAIPVQILRHKKNEKFDVKLVGDDG